MRTLLFRAFVLASVVNLLVAVCFPHHHHGDGLCMGMAHEASSAGGGRELPVPDNGRHASDCIAHTPYCRTAPSPRPTLMQAQQMPVWAAAVWCAQVMPQMAGMGQRTFTPYHRHPLRPPAGRCKTPRAPPVNGHPC